jgi:hypothetical protein
MIPEEFVPCSDSFNTYNDYLFVLFDDRHAIKTIIEFSINQIFLNKHFHQFAVAET